MTERHEHVAAGGGAQPGDVACPRVDTGRFLRSAGPQSSEDSLQGEKAYALRGEIAAAPPAPVLGVRLGLYSVPCPKGARGTKDIRL
jgi:hypothetical protein